MRMFFQILDNFFGHHFTLKTGAVRFQLIRSD